MDRSTSLKDLTHLDNREYRPGGAALAVSLELALKAGRALAWAYNPARDELWIAEPFELAFRLAVDDPPTRSPWPESSWPPSWSHRPAPSWPPSWSRRRWDWTGNRSAS